MPSHADILPSHELNRPEPLTKPFWVSMTLHIVVLGGFSAGALLNGNHLNMGSLTGGGMGGVMVNPVASIPLPNRGGPENPVANDTQSQVPTPPAPKEKPKPVPKPKAPPADAIPLKSDRALAKRQAEAPVQPNKYRDQQKDNVSQLYTAGGQRLSSSNYAVQGGGGVRMGDSSPFGEQFGTYANIIRDNIARCWKPASAGRTLNAPSVVVTFTIRRDGSVTNVKVSQPSGIQAMDFSAQRAVLDAQLPPLPPNFPRNQADVEMKFELGN
jgi:periplasmic protein TonB